MAFSEDSAAYYAHYARAYPPGIFDRLVGWMEVGQGDLVLDLGCGSGQLSLPLAGRARHVLGVDAEADMLAFARTAAEEQGITDVSWLLGSDRDLAHLPELLGDRSVAAVTISNALHLMDAPMVFSGLRRLLVPGGRIAVIANGLPLWLQDSDWSRALLAFLEAHLAATLGQASPCGTDVASQSRYRQLLESAGYATSDEQVHYRDEIEFPAIVGRVYAAMPRRALPDRADRPAFEDGLRAALRAVHHGDRYPEEVPVAVLIGRCP